MRSMIDRFPNCSFSLLGLRDRKSCPECGMEFGRESRDRQVYPPSPRDLTDEEESAILRARP